MAKKYIDADKLIAEIERRIGEHKKSLKKDITLISEAMLKGSLGAYESIENLITSLQQEQNSAQDTELTYFESALFTAFSYAWQSYLRGEEVNVAQWAKENSAELLEAARFPEEQPEVDLEKEIQEYIQKLGFGYGGWVDGLSDEDLKNIARYFYELGLKARKEE